MIIKNGHVISPLSKKDGVFDILIEGSRIKEVSKNITGNHGEIIDAKNKIVIPGLIDMHVHLREPGREDVETVKTATRAAMAGGITSVCSMPNTQPPIDDRESVRLLKGVIERDAEANVFVIGAVTKGRSGKEIVDMEAMASLGIGLLSDDGNAIQDESVMLEALKLAKKNGLLLISHCEDRSLSKSGVVNEGIMATKLGLRGIPKKAEYSFVKRDIELAGRAKAKIHIAHVSCKESADIIRKAKKDGVNVTAETAPHYFSLTDDASLNYDTRTKMNPPLRSIEDVEAIKEALSDGTIDAIASDHAPHGKHDKEIEFEFAAFGIIGLETSLALSVMNLLGAKGFSWTKLVELMSTNPAGILGLNHKGNLSSGSDADIAIIDPEKRWVYTKNSIRSKSKNSPFINWHFKGKVTDVIVNGKRY